MITKFKIFESYDLETFLPKRGDIVLRPDKGSSSRIFIVLKDHTPGEWLSVYQIGDIGRTYGGVIYASLIFNTKSNMNVKSKIRYNSESYPTSFRCIRQQDKDLIYESVQSNKYERYLDIVTKETGIDIKESDEYKKWCLENDSKKYNL